MKSSRSPRERLGAFLSGVARQLELPLFGTAQPPVRTAPPAKGAPDAPPLRDGVRHRSIVLGERSLDYAFRRGRRRTIGLTITSEGLTVAAPRWVGIREVEETIRERESWIFTKLAELRRSRAAIPQVQWQDGGTLPYRGDMLTMKAASGRQRASVLLDRNAGALIVSLPPGATAAQWKDRVETWLQAEARAIFKERLALYEKRLGVQHRTLRLSSAKTRWGSCSADGRILLNWRLVHFPLSTIDYVVAHELAHLKEMNHGPRFWSTVASILPEYEVAREQMKNPPPELLPTL